jgi:ceramide glucosyltransferase
MVTTLLVALAALGSCLATAVSHACVHFKLRRRRRDVEFAPPISVLKPLKGIDDGLEDNLCSLARQRYPGRFELILGAADPQDPALEVALRIRRRFPGVPIKLVAGREGPALNPKVANLIGMLDLAEHDTLLISDSNVRVDATYLRDVASEMADPRVGLVSNLIAGDGEQSLGAALENLHLNSWIAAGVATSSICRHPVVIGKSMMLRRSDLEQLGGLRAVEDVLGEDYLLGRAFARAGHAVVISPHVVRTINAQWDLRRFLSRHLRWTQMRRWIAPRLYAFEPLVNPLPILFGLGTIVALRDGALGYGTSAWLSAIGIATAGKVGSDAVLSRRLRGRWPSALGVLAVPVKDVLVLGLWCVAWVYRSVTWRGNKLRIGPGSVLSLPAVDEAVDFPRTAG